VYLNWPIAEELCRKRGRRLCTATEWERACRGPNNREYSTASGIAELNTCNTADTGGHNGELVPSGAEKLCVSGYGVADMSGNAAEWTQTPLEHSRTTHIVKGGSAIEGLGKTRCGAERYEDDSVRNRILGFRCCSRPTK
jgi:formylglycine-generating enzyme required for sulfatase activity